MHKAFRATQRWVDEPAPLPLLVAAALLALADWGSRLAGDSFIPGGPADETAHLMTTLLVVWALGPRVARRLVVPALLASVLIDGDHIPQYLGTRVLTEGTARPYTHSLLTLVVVVGLAAAWRRRREPLLGVALGLAIHFWRDLSESGSGVALLWPLRDTSFSLPHGAYLLVMAGVVAVVAARLATRPTSVHRSAPGLTAPRGRPDERLDVRSSVLEHA